MLCYEFPPIGGGGAKVVDGLTKAFGHVNHEIHLITMGFKNLPSYERRNNFHIHRVKCLRFNESICTPPEMFTYIVSGFFYAIKLKRQHNFELNHTHFIFPDGIIAFLLYKIIGLKYIVTAHGSDVPGYNPNRFKLFHKILHPIWKTIVASSRLMIFPSNNLFQLFQKVESKKAGIIIPNGISLEKFSPSLEKKNKILVVSRMFERKGVQYVLKALEGLNHNYGINIVGDGPYLNFLKKIANELKVDINFLGFIDNDSEELKSLFEESKIFIFTSESENFPIVLLEAMVAGMAIITTKGTGCEEVVGDAAILVEPRNPEEIKIALQKLLDDPMLISNLQKAARRRVEDLFSWESTANKYLEVYNNIFHSLK